MTAGAQPPWKTYEPHHFDDRVALVTGAASGIGLETARAFAGLGARTVLLDRDEPALKSAASDLPRAQVVTADITDQDSVAAAFDQIDHEHGRLDHVAHCAAVITSTPTLEADPEHWRRVLDINLVGTFSIVQAALRRMTESERGTIVLVGSDAGSRGGGGRIADAVYAASKAGVLNVVKSLAREFAGSGIRVNAIAPGPTDTPLHKHVPDTVKQDIAKGIPLGRMGRPEDIAAGIVFLSSEASSFMNGSALDVDGGTALR